MIISKAKNQQTAKNAITDFMNENPTFAVTRVAKEMELINFVKFLAQRLLKRAESDDCYLIDMLGDLERLDD